MFSFIIKNLETIRNITVFLASTFVTIGLGVFYFKVYFNFNKIKAKNEIIEKIQSELDQDEINNIRGTWHMSLEDSDGFMAKKKRIMEQKIQKLGRERRYLLEEISIFKIFKK